MTTTRTLPALDCGHHAAPDLSGAGYATDRATGRTLCYPCADDEERARMTDPATRVIVAYVSSDGLSVTTWSGGQLGRYIPGTASVSRSGWRDATGQRSRIWSHRFRAADGSQWYGRNAGNGMCITLRRAMHNI